MHFRLNASGVFLFLAVLLLAARVGAQEPKDPDCERESEKEEKEEEAKSIEEVGGRLLLTGETVLVQAEVDAPPRSSSIATKIETPLLETPRSVSLVDRRTLDDLYAINITQAHDLTPGMVPMDERGPAYSRGFLVDFYDLRRDGVRTYAWSVREPAALDRIQYLRGPASILYGDGSPGGLINLVLKKPLPVPRYEIGVGLGELGFGRVTADATGPLTESRRARYRLVAAGEWLENGFENDERRLSFLPTLSFDLGERTTLHLDAEYYDQRGRAYRHAVPATEDFSRIPWDLNMSSPDDEWSGWNASPGLRLDTRLRENVTLHVAGRYTKIEGDLDLEGLSALAPDERTALRLAYRERSEWGEYQTDSFATLSFGSGGLDHQLVVGLEAGLSTTDSAIGIGPASPIDIYDPVYPPKAPEPQTQPIRHDLTRLGVYVMDQIRITPAVILVPGLRFSRLAMEDLVREASSSEGSFSPSLGVVTLPRSWLSLYAQYAQGFEPPSPGQFLEDGSAVEPVESESFEAGVKTEVLEDRLSVTGAIFWMRRDHVIEPDARGFYQQIGEGESRGVEIEMVGRLAPGLGVRASYAFTDAEVTRDLAGFTGNELPNAPRHKANLWLRYRFADGSRLSGFSVAGGVVSVSDRFTAANNLTVVPSYTRFDATASWEVLGPRLVLGLGASNLTNLRYATAGAGVVLFAGAPRRISFQLQTAF